MRESLGTTKPKGVMKVKSCLVHAEGGCAGDRTGAAHPGRLVLIAS